MREEFTLSTTVSYWDVDREERLTLAGVFKFLQEAAIRHADQFDTGARTMQTRGETWVLNRLAAAITRYPHYDETLRIVTWSSGIRAFKGYRDFRVYCGEEVVVAASSLWLYVNLATKTLTRVPAEVAANFPARAADVFRPDLDKLRLAPPASGARELAVTLRYADFDGNGHVNNTAYFDYLQTALQAGGFAPRPGAVEIQFLKEISPAVGTAKVRLEPRGGSVAFGIVGPAELHAQGAVSFAVGG